MTDKKLREPRKPFDYFTHRDCELPRDCRFDINYDIRLGPYSDLTYINIKIKKRNILIDVEIPEECALLVPPRGIYFSLENLSGAEHPNYRFTT